MADKPYTVRADDTSTPNRIYAGVAEPGALTTDPVWRIKVLDKVGGGAAIGDTVLWAEGKTSFEFAWSARTLYNYS
jgi:hypothetical protein